MDEFLDNIFSLIYLHVIMPIINFLGSIIRFMLSTPASRIIFALLFVNLIGFFLMHHDKKVATNNGKTKKEFLTENNTDIDSLSKEQKRQLNRVLERRTPESTFLIIAAVGGSLRNTSWHVQVSS